jgi:hypothetical protein
MNVPSGPRDPSKERDERRLGGFVFVPDSGMTDLAQPTWRQL